MNEESIVKQSLLLTGKLVGVIAAWVALLSFVAVTLTARIVDGLSGSPTEKVQATKAAPSDAPGRPRSDPAVSNPTKPNG